MVLNITNDLPEIEKAQQALRAFAIANCPLPTHTIHQLSVVIDEVLTNIINHGYEDILRHEIIIQFSNDPKNLYIQFDDDGIPFNPALAKTRNPGIQRMKEELGGTGIQLIKGFADDLNYVRNGQFNRLVIRKSLPE